MQSREVMLDPEEEYVILPVRVLEKIVKYALTVCQDRCPTERDPETCLYLVKLCKLLGMPRPPCLEQDYEDFTVDTFRKIVKRIESKYGMHIQDFVRKVQRRGPRSLEENSDFLEASFALTMLRLLSRDDRQNIIIVRGSCIKIVNE